MQVQERLTDQIRTAFKSARSTLPLFVEAQHMYANAEHSETKFSYYDFFFTGYLKDKTRKEFIN
jgi:GTP cyclohydrolase I